MQDAPIERRQPAWRIGLAALAILAVSGLAAVAQDAAAPAAAAAKPKAASGGGGGYFIEFRARYAWDYGHTFVVFGRPGERIGKNNVAGLSPVGDDATAWVIGHYVPVPSETGWTDGDLEDKYISARFRVSLTKEQYDRTIAYIRRLQATSPTWSAELYNCNAFVADVAKFMGLKVPASTLIYPKVFVNNLRKINTGHPEAADTLVSENVKEMQNPTRDGRAMINTGVRTVQAERKPAPAATGANVTIGRVRVGTGASNSAVAASQPSQ